VVASLSLAAVALAGGTARLLARQADQHVWQRLGGGTRTADQLADYLNRLAAEPGIASVSVAVIDRGQIVFARTVGVVDPRTRRTAGAKTVFRGASLSKPVFAYLVMRLVDKGVLDLDTPVVRYLPRPLHTYAGYESLRDDPRVERLTARRILSQRSGLPNWRRVRPSGPIAFVADPGGPFGYSGEGYSLLQFVLETVTGRDLGVLAREQVFEPLGMTDSSFLWEARFDGRFAVELDSDLGRLIEQSRRAGNAAGSLITNAPDYARLVTAVMTGQGLSDESRAAMLKPEVDVTSRSLFSLPGTDGGAGREHRLAWTPGWGTFTDAYGRALFHVGREEGCENYVEARLDGGQGIAILSLSTNPESFTGPLVDYAIGTGYSPLAWLEYGSPNPVRGRGTLVRRALFAAACVLVALLLVRAVALARRAARH
jgi:CubicO group peptidase (beta-lactamase class C family)